MSLDSQHFLLGCTDASLIRTTIWRPINLLVQQLARRHGIGTAGTTAIEENIWRRKQPRGSSPLLSDEQRSCFQEVAADQEVAQILSEVKGFKCCTLHTI